MRRGAKPAKAKVEAKPPAARKSRTSEGSKVHDLEKRLEESLAREEVTAKLLQEKSWALTEALEQQTATSEILQVISSSPTDVQPVFDAIASSVVRLCDAFFSTVWRYDGALIHHAADNYPTAEMRAILTKGFPAPAEPGSVVALAISERRIIHVADLLDDSAPAASREVAISLGYRTLLCVPMLRDGMAAGAIAVARREQRPYSDRQIELVKTFADQAVIAIENVQLFKELETRNRELTESLEQQTATSEILRVISSSPTNLQPVLDAVSENAARLCEASDGVILLVEGSQLRAAAHHGQAFDAAVDRPVSRDGVAGRAVIDRASIHLPDVRTADDFPLAQRLSRADGSRTVLATPLMREAVAVGAILIRRAEVRPFSDKQIALLKTFADQAVIAIENVRLFTELQEKNKAVTQALEQQTATSEILRVISNSPTDVQPVFEAIARSAVRLCGGVHGGVLRLSDDVLSVVAHENLSPISADMLLSLYPASPDRAGLVGLAIRHRDIVHSPDVQRDPRTAHPELARRAGYSSVLAVPIMRSGEPIGGIFVTSTAPFATPQMELLKTFAEQAVIAIENVRLFKELQASNSELKTALYKQTATSDILRVISQSQTDVQPVFDAILSSAIQLMGASAVR